MPMRKPSSPHPPPFVRALAWALMVAGCGSSSSTAPDSGPTLDSSAVVDAPLPDAALPRDADNGDHAPCTTDASFWCANGVPGGVCSGYLWQSTCQDGEWKCGPYSIYSGGIPANQCTGDAGTLDAG